MRTCRRTLCAGLSRSQRLCTRLSSTAAPSIDRRAFGEGMVRNDSTRNPRDAAKLAITSDPNAPHGRGVSLSLSGTLLPRCYFDVTRARVGVPTEYLRERESCTVSRRGHRSCFFPLYRVGIPTLQYNTVVPSRSSSRTSRLDRPMP